MNHDCDEASTKTSTEQIIRAFLVNWDRPREQYGYTLHHGSLDHCSSLPRGFCLCLLPLTGHSSAAVARSYFKVNPSLWPPWPIPQWLWFSESQILILKVLKGSPGSVPIASLSSPFCFTRPQSTWLQSPWSCLPLKHTKHIFLTDSAQCLFITEGFPDPLPPPESPSLPFFMTLIKTWHRIFPFLLSVSLLEGYIYIFFVCLFVCLFVCFYCILLTAVSLLKKLCSWNQKDKFW